MNEDIEKLSSITETDSDLRKIGDHIYNDNNNKRGGTNSMKAIISKALILSLGFICAVSLSACGPVQDSSAAKEEEVSSVTKEEEVSTETIPDDTEKAAENDSEISGTDMAEQTRINAFYTFLKEKYNNADEYVEGYPRYSDSNGGGETYIKFAEADFDGDGKTELLVYNGSFTFAEQVGENADGIVGIYRMYECDEKGNVSEFGTCMVLDTFHQGEIVCYDTMVIDLVSENSVTVLGYGDEYNEKMGLKDHPNTVVSYQENSDGTMERLIHGAYQIEDDQILSHEEYEQEYNSVRGKQIKVVFEDFLIEKIDQYR